MTRTRCRSSTGGRCAAWRLGNGRGSDDERLVRDADGVALDELAGLDVHAEVQGVVVLGDGAQVRRAAGELHEQLLGVIVAVTVHVQVTLVGGDEGEAGGAGA